MTNLDLAWLYAELCVKLSPKVGDEHAEAIARHRSNAVDHVACAASPDFDPDATREGIAQVLRLAGAIN